MVASCINSPLVAFLVPCRAVTWEISWAMTPASSDFSDVAVADGLDVFLGILGSNGVFLLDWLGAGLLLGLLLGGRRCLCGFLARGILTLGESEGRTCYERAK